MSRSALDATRFTATLPHAYSKTFLRSSPSSATHTTKTNTPPPRPPNPNAARKPPPGPKEPPPGPKQPPPPAETPRQKVARLRAARFLEKADQITKWDRIVLRGRVWADRAHRFTVLTIVGFSIVAAGVTAFAITDMILHSRRKRAAILDEQSDLNTARLLEAIEAEKAGLPLDEDLSTVLNRERAKVLAKEAGWKNRVKNFFIGGLKQDEEEQVPEIVPSETQVPDIVEVDQPRILETAEGKASIDELETERRNKPGILQAVEEKRRKGEKTMQKRGIEGGPLDQIAQGAVDKSSNIGGWMSWGRGK